MANDQPSPPGSWKHRRRLIYGILIYCAVAVPVLTLRHPESVMVSQVVMALVALAASTIATYVGGATWDDYNARKAKDA